MRRPTKLRVRRGDSVMTRGTQRVAFSAPEYQADGSIHPISYEFSGDPEDGWEIRRAGHAHLRLGEGYRLLRVSHCGICATDLARRHLPFRLPQITGHEVVALDTNGAAVAVEINASHAARGLVREDWCAMCRQNLPTHCPERLVLGIHDLPGGFSPWILAPVDNIVPLPPTIRPATATLVEPFAAALHAVQNLAPAEGDSVAVLGPRRLGSLVIAALAAMRRRSGQRFDIVAVTRRPQTHALARALGADRVIDAAAASALHDLADVVVETSANPDGLLLATQLAKREVHVKSTTGQPTLGLAHLTELVVDEIALVALDDAEYLRNRLKSCPDRVAMLLGADLSPAIAAKLESQGLTVIAGEDPAALAAVLAEDSRVPLNAADLAVVTSLGAIDTVIRPRTGQERGLVRPRGTIAVADVGQPRGGLLAAILDRGLRFTTTRCGAFRPAVELLADPDTALGERLGELMVTDILPAERLAAAFARAASPDSIKVIATHDGGLL